MLPPLDHELRRRAFDASPTPIVVLDPESLRFIDCNAAAVRIYGLLSREAMLSLTPLDVSSEFQYDGSSSGQKAREWIAAALQQGSVSFEWAHRRPDGELWDGEVHLLKFVMENRPLLQFSLIDITERKLRERAYRELHQLALALDGAGDVHHAEQRILQAVLEVAGFEAGGYYAVDDNDGSLVLVAHQGLSPEFVASIGHLSADSPSARLARTGQPHFGSHAEVAPVYDTVRINEGLRALAVLPVMSQGQLLAVLNLASRRTDTISAASRQVLGFVALSAGEILRRVRADAARKATLDWSQRIIDAIPTGLFTFEYGPGERLVLEFANRAGQQLTGVGGPDWTGRDFEELWPKSRELGIIARCLTVMRTAEPIELGDVQYADGRVSGCFHIRAFPISPTRLGVVFDDVTQLRATEEESSFHRELLAAFLRHSPILAYIKEVTERGSVTLEASRSFETLVGVPGEELRGKYMEEIFPPEFAAKLTADDREVMTRAEPTRLEEVFGGRFYSTIKFPIDLWGRHLLAGYTIDITESKRLEFELRAQESRLRAIIENQPGSVWLKDPEGRFLAVNQAFVELAGKRSPEELIGRRDEELWPAPLATKYRADDLEVMRTKRALRTEEEIEGAHQTHWFETYKAPLLDDRGEVVGTTGFAHDVTSRRRAAEEREHLLSQLNQTQKMEALATLSAGIAHDFNNLLGGIYGCIELTRLDIPAEADPEGNLESALLTIERARALTQQLLTFAKGGTPVKKPQSIVPVLRQAVHFALSGSSICPQFELADQLFPADFDKNQIAQVIENIVINAVQAMPNGGVLTVRAENRELLEMGPGTLPPGHYLEITIIDQGVGIPKEYLPRIFDPFYTTKPKGHGLGLATSFSIIARHGGRIEAQSAPGVGSSFSVFLPALTGRAVTDAPHLPIEHQGRGTVLIMDDEDSIRKATGAMLRRLGYDTILARDGAEVLAQLEPDQPELLLRAMIFDLTVPGGMGGKETRRHLPEAYRHVPVFVCSGYADDPIMADPVAHGFVASIKKPFRLAELAELMETHLSPHNAPPRSRRAS